MAGSLNFMCRFARAWGRGGVVVTNLVPYRATEPVALRDAEDPLGEEATPGIGWVRRHAEAAPGALVICCWGVLRWGWLRERAEDFVTAWRFGVDPRPLHHLGLTKGGFPRHPLYLPGDVQPQEWKP